MKKHLKALSATLLTLSFLSNPISATACTSFLLKGNDGFVYGRSMEFGINLKSEFLVMPRNFENKGVGPDGIPGSGLTWRGKYAAFGLNALGQPVFVDGMNEKGLAGGLLNAPGTAVYQNPTGSDGKNSIASYQMLSYVLTSFASVDEARIGLHRIFVNSSTLPAYKGVVRVHMTLHDTSGKSIVVEYLDGKLVITDNPTGVMTNDPFFSWHLDNIGNYANLTPIERPPLVINGAKFAPPSSGSGLHGLPGDMLSPSRFIRALAYTMAAPKNLSAQAQVNTAWHILGNFDIPPGSVTLPASNPYGGGAGGYETTEWSVVADTRNLTYDIRTYDNLNIQRFELKKADLDATELRTIPLVTSQRFQSLN